MSGMCSAADIAVSPLLGPVTCWRTGTTSARSRLDIGPLPEALHVSANIVILSQLDDELPGRRLEVESLTLTDMWSVFNDMHMSSYNRGDENLQCQNSARSFPDDGARRSGKSLDT